MNIKDFIKNYHNHPVFFIGTGFSLRYLSNSFSWNSLLNFISNEIYGNNERYLELKVEHQHKNLDKIATILEKELTEYLVKNRNHSKFKDVNDEFFKLASEGKSISRFKIFLSKILSQLEKKSDDKTLSEIALLKKARKNIGSIITTNYDTLIENIFEFNPLIGNDILLSNPYGSVYKIHGCTTQPESMIITDQDYINFNKRYELIRAQLLSLFIHNPIIFIGYSINDENIKSLLKTIFTYVTPNSEQAQRIRDNFLLVEYDKDSDSEEVCEHDIDLEGYSTIRINKIKTDNYSIIYQAISDLMLPVSAMDIRKIQSVMADITSGGAIQVSITESIDSLKNDDKILVIGSKKTVKYEYQTRSEMMENYFKIIEEANNQLILLLNKQTIPKGSFFPMYQFSQICTELNNINKHKEAQKEKLKEHITKISKKGLSNNSSIEEIHKCTEISLSDKENAIFFDVYKKNISLDECKLYLKSHKEKTSTNYRRLLCLYDYMVTNTETLI